MCFVDAMTTSILTHSNKLLKIQQYLSKPTLKYSCYVVKNCCLVSNCSIRHFSKKHKAPFFLAASRNWYSHHHTRFISSSPKPNDVKGWVSRSTEKVYEGLNAVSPRAKEYVENLARGAQANWSDIRTYWFVRKRLKVNPSAPVTYHEEMRIFLFKRDAFKIIPLIPFFLVPFGFITLFIPIYFFPRHVLPHTFWTAAQRKKFFSQMHLERLPHYSIILHHMNYHRENSSDSNMTYLLNDIFAIVHANNIPSNSLLLQFKPFCKSSSSPFNLHNLKVGVLLRSFSRVSLSQTFLLPAAALCSQLQAYGESIIKLDQKLRSSNSLQRLSARDIEIAALLRGVNSANLTTEANMYWLKNWLELTKHCSLNDVWFVLHAMVLLSYNYNQLKFQRSVFD